MRTFFRSLHLLLAASAACVGFLAAPGARGQSVVNLYEISRFDLSATSNVANPEYVGSNPVAVAWNGSKLYVAGFNGSGSANNTSIIEITNTTATGLGIDPTYSAVFGTLSTVSSRGFTGLDINGSSLAASWDNGSNSPNSIRVFNTTTNAETWSLANSGSSTVNIGTTRGMSGPAFDPGYNGDPSQGGGVAWVTQGQGRRFLNDTSTGAAIYTTTAGDPAGASQGMIINTSPVSTTWRDFAFDPATGNLYARTNNQVTRSNRTGANANISPSGTVGASTTIVPLTTSNNVATNVGYMNSVAASSLNPFSGDLLVFNNRASTAPGQDFSTVMQFSDTDGAAVTPVWNFLAAMPTGTAGYDFGWDSATQTLAVMDYSNRSVSVFSTAVPEPTTSALLGTLAIAAGLAARRRLAPKV